MRYPKGEPVRHRLTAVRRVHAFLSCASCRFAPFYFVPFFAGLLEGGAATVPLSVFGAIFWINHSLAIEVTNRLAERVEDEVNRPERTALCDTVGWGTLAKMQWVLWSTLALMALAWLTLDGNPLLVAMIAASFAVGLAYSRGPHFSRRRWFAFFTLNMLFGGSFLVGWAAGNPFGTDASHGWSQLESFAPMLSAVGVFILSLAGIKDITDQAGDAGVGYRSLFVTLIRRPRNLLPFAVAMSPFIVLAVFALTGLLPLRMAALVVFAPLSAALVSAARRAIEPSDSLVVREAFYVYWLAYSSLALLAYLPDVRLLCVVLGSWLFWFAATSLAHWSSGLKRRDVGLLWRLARGPGAPPLRPAAQG